MTLFTQTNRENGGKNTIAGYAKTDVYSPAALQPANDSPNKRAALLTRSPQVQAQLQRQKMFDQSPRVVAQAKLSAAINSRYSARQTQPVQRQEILPDEEEFTTPQAQFEEEEPTQFQSIEEEEPTQLQTAPEEDALLSEEFEPLQKKENRTGLPDGLKSGIENLSGFSMDDVKVHYNSAQPATVQALAYAQGTDIHVAPGQEQHLPHEAWHVAQQKQGRVQPTLQHKGVAINNDAGLEKEADVMGESAARFDKLNSGNGEEGNSLTTSNPVQRMLKTAEAGTKVKVWIASSSRLAKAIVGSDYDQDAEDYNGFASLSVTDVYKDGKWAPVDFGLGIDPSFIYPLETDNDAIAETEDYDHFEPGEFESEFGDVMGGSEKSKSSVGDRKEIELEEEEDDEEEVVADKTAFYHGTDLKTAQALLKGVKIDARGKGELGGGFYMTHDLYQAAHIADYYTGKEKRGSSWGVVKFDIPTIALQGPLKNKKVVDAEEFEDYYNQVKQTGNKKESPYSWTIGPIKDKATPYMQHLFASHGLAALNDKTTTRTLVLSGIVGIEKAKYLDEVAEYDPEEDAVFNALVEMEPDMEEDLNEVESEVDYAELESRVNAALKANNKRLTQNVIGELEDALEILPEDKQILAWLESLQK